MKLAAPSMALMLCLSGCLSASKKPIRDAVPLPSSQPSAPTPEPQASATASPAIPDSSGRITTASGLQYKIISSGPADGRSPSMFDTVLVHYRGTLTDGTVFDSSLDRGMPASFGVSQVIPGWTEALRLMKPGDEWMLYIPARLAYGNRAVGGKIPPNSDLIFQVKLLQVIGGL